jgi:short-subunit dehydrogenase
MKPKVLITGASSGLGIHLAKKFEENGHPVFRHHGRKDYNLTDVEEVQQLAFDAISAGVEVLVNNAAIVCPNILLNEYTTAQICDMIEVNLKAPILLTHYLLPYVKNVININSMVGLEVKQPRTLYSATKWGLRGFSNSLKKENSSTVFLDVYPTTIKTKPGRKNAMEVGMVVDKIYTAYTLEESELVLDGRVK